MKSGIGGIYLIKNIINNKIYIGSTINFNTRQYLHFRDLEKNQHCNKYLQRAYKKYGKESFLFEVIEEIKDQLLLITREQYWMDFTKSYISTYGYNNCKIAGSVLGYRHTNKTRKKLKQWNRRTLPHVKKLTFNGITKPLGDWADEYKLPIGLVQSRLNTLKWSIEKTLTTPHKPITKIIEYNGRTQSMKMWAEEFKLSLSTLSARLKRGFTLERALNFKVKKFKN